MAQAAARLNDPIGHSPTMSWLLAGVIAAAAIAVTAVAVVGTGGLAAAAIIGGAAAAGGGIGEVLSTMSWAPKEEVGNITATGSPNVFTNGLRAIRAHLDMAKCDKHTDTEKVATGSGKVFINSMPAARVDDKTTCSATITKGSPNVNIGGETVQTDEIHAEDLVPTWVHVALFVVGAGAAVVLAGPVIAAAGLAGGLAGGMGGGWLGGKIFGEGSDGQKWSMLGGSLLGGWFGAKRAGAWKAARETPAKIESPDLENAPGYLKLLSDFKKIPENEIGDFYANMRSSGVDYEGLIAKAINEHGLTPDEAHAVFGYTTKLFYRDLNQSLLTGGTKEANALTELIGSGLQKMPGSGPTQYRGWRLDSPTRMAEFDNQFKIGNTVESNFWSTAPNKADAYLADRNVTIFTNSAKDISDLSFGVNFHHLIGKPVYSAETLIPPGVKFQVVGVDRSGNLILEQL